VHAARVSKDDKTDERPHDEWLKKSMNSSVEKDPLLRVSKVMGQRAMEE
jgi:hypothetical protein